MEALIIDVPGVYAVDAASYHSDICPTPSLSASIITTLVQRSPLHAWAVHPRLSNNPVREEARHLDLGTLAHSILLEGLDVAVVIDADSFRTKKSQEERDVARLAGKCPVLKDEMPEVLAMVAACRLQLERHESAFDAFTDKGRAEVTLVWKESNGIYCRARLDWLHHDKPRIYDLKTSARSAHPQSLSRIASANGWCIQSAWYMRGLKAIFGQDIQPEFYFVAVENFRPFALSVVETSPADLALAEAQIEYAIQTWGRCLETGVWPGYSNRVQRITSPPYVEAAWMERETEEA